MVSLKFRSRPNVLFINLRYLRICDSGTGKTISADLNSRITAICYEEIDPEPQVLLLASIR